MLHKNIKTRFRTDMPKSVLNSLVLIDDYGDILCQQIFKRISLTFSKSISPEYNVLYNIKILHTERNKNTF